MNYSWVVRLDDVGEYLFAAGADDAALTTSWPTASSSSVLSSPGGGANVVAWSLGSNSAGTPGETLTSGYTAGIYGFRGGNTKEFSKYGVTSGAWTSKAQPTNGIEKGGALTKDGAGTLYAFEGNSKIFFKYDIATNLWTRLADTSNNVIAGGALQYLEVGGVKYVYALLGGSNRFRRYNVALNTWTVLMNTPANVKEGGALTTDGTYLYALQGDNTRTFWRYDIAGNSWTAMASTPATVDWGGSLTRAGNYFYALRGNGKRDFWRYDIAGNSWSSLALTPGNVAEGGRLTTDGTYLYAFQGKTKAFWRYHIATNTWVALAAVNFAGNVGQGGALVYDAGTSPIGYYTDMHASPALVSSGNTVQVNAHLQSDSAVSNVVPSALSITGTPEYPYRPGPTVGDTGAGLHCLNTILAALLQRERTGRGQRIEVSMQEAVVSLCRNSYYQMEVLGRATPRAGNQNPVSPNIPANVYACKPFGPNDYCFISCTRAHTKHWERLAQAMGREDLLSDPRFATDAARVAHSDELDQIIGEWTGQHTKHEVTKILGEAGVPTGAVLDTLELSNDPYLRKRGMFVTIKHPVRGEMFVPGWPVKMSDSPVDIVTAPLLGEHTAEIYQEWLGLDEQQVAQLRAEKVI